MNINKIQKYLKVLLLYLIIIITTISCGNFINDNSVILPDQQNSDVQEITKKYYTGGTVSGLSGSLVLNNNGEDELAITSNGQFTFPSALEDGTSFSITISAQPAGLTCSIINGNGTINGADVTDVLITCSVNTYRISGNISGLNGTVVLQNNGEDDLELFSNIQFIFTRVIADASNYNVTVLSQPAEQVCSVSNGTGIISGSDINDIQVTCSNIYIIGGSVFGLSGTLVLQNNGGDDLNINSDGSFTFPAKLFDGSNYTINVFSQPTGQTCVTSNESGTISGSNITDIQVICSNNTYTVTYDFSGADSGTVPVDSGNYEYSESVTVFDNTGNLDKSSEYFLNWNTQADGNGIDYTGGATFIMGSSDVVLYVEWAPKIIAVSAGGYHSLFIKSDGTLWAAGDNDYGQYGNGTTFSSSTPVQVMENVSAVSAGARHTMILKSDGTLWGTGWNTYGQIGDGTNVDRTTPVQVMSNVSAISAVGNATMILKTDATLWAAGVNNDGQLGDGTNINKSTPVQIMSGVAKVSTSGSHTMILKTDGTLWATGSNGWGGLGDGTTVDKNTPIQIMTNVADVSAGGSFTYILKNDGTLFTTGFNILGQLGDGTFTDKNTPVQIMNNVLDIYAGGEHALILKNDNTLWVTGSNIAGQHGDGTTTNKNTPVQVMDSGSIFSASYRHTIIIKTDGRVWITGENTLGQLGDGSTTSTLTFKKIF